MIETTSCWECGQGGVPSLFPVPSTTQRGILTECPNGHKLAIVLQASGWARLFERGLKRLVLGDTRDAILDAYTAFEMYLSDVPARVRYDREKGASPAALREELKPATARSECAIGAARAAASLATGKPAITWSEKDTTAVRNRAIHAGAYPSEEEAEKLCLEVGRVILAFEDALDALPCVNSHSYHEAAWLEEASVFQRGNPGVRTSFSSGGVIFDWAFFGKARPSVAARIQEYRSDPRNLMWAMLGMLTGH